MAAAVTKGATALLAVCSTGIYPFISPLKADNTVVQFCKDHYPVPAVTITKRDLDPDYFERHWRRAAKTTTTTTSSSIVVTTRTSSSATSTVQHTTTTATTSAAAAGASTGSTAIHVTTTLSVPTTTAPTAITPIKTGTSATTAAGTTAAVSFNVDNINAGNKPTNLADLLRLAEDVVKTACWCIEGSQPTVTVREASRMMQRSQLMIEIGYSYYDDGEHDFVHKSFHNSFHDSYYHHEHDSFHNSKHHSEHHFQCLIKYHDWWIPIKDAHALQSRS
jgi:hypothetical protein